MLSGYRLVWLVTIFDLPVTTKSERKEASKFRYKILDLGFQMVQFSVYMKHCAGKEQGDVIIAKIAEVVPAYGNVKVLQITDKQYGAIRHFGRHSAASIQVDQLALF